MTASLPRIAITAGEPAGIGPGIVAALAATAIAADLAAFGSSELIERAARARKLDTTIEAYDGRPRTTRSPGALRCVDVALGAPVVFGKLDVRNAAHVIAVLTAAADACRSGEFDALVTAPVQKSIIADAGI